MRCIIIFIFALVASSAFAQPKRIEYRHDLRAGIGLPTPKYFGSCNGITTEYSNPNLYVYYGYRIHKGWKATVALSHYTNHEFTKEPQSGYPNINDRESHFRITPAVQYEWFNRGLVTMYSDIGLTVEFTAKEYKTDGVITDDGRYTYVRPNVTPFGITVGKKLFGFAELFSFGPRGFFNMGVGYRF